MKYYLIPINESRVFIRIYSDEEVKKMENLPYDKNPAFKSLKDLLYEKYPEFGELEINRTTIKFDGIEKNKDKKINKIDSKLEAFLDNNNIPKYIACQKFPSGYISENETDTEVLFNSEIVELYQVPFDDVYNYYFASCYDERINEFLNKKPTFIKEDKPKVKTKTKSKTKKVSD